MRKIIVLISLLLLIIVSVAVLYFSKLGAVTRNNDKVLAFIPRGSSLVAGFRNDHTFYDIFKDYRIFKAILGDSSAADLSQLQDLVLTQPFISEAIEGQHTFLSFVPATSGSVGLLWLITIGQGSDEDIRQALLTANAAYKTTEITLSGKSVLALELSSTKRTCYLFVADGMAVGSFSREALSLSLDKQQPKISSGFVETISKGSQQNENSPVNLFIDHGTSASFLTTFLKGKFSGYPALIGKLSGYTTLNLNYKSDALMFSGISLTDTVAPNYLNLFVSQKPVPVTLLNTFPGSTANYLAFGLSDYPAFYSGLHRLLNKRKELEKLETQFRLLRNNSGYDINDLIKPSLSNEFAVFQLADQQKLAIIKIQNGSTFATSLEGISTTYSENIAQLRNANIPYYFFGDPMKGFSRPYFTVIDNYWVIANTPSTLQQFLYTYKNGDLLSKTAEFKKFNQFVADQSNVSLFIQKGRSGSVFRSVLKPQYEKLFRDASSGLNNFYGFSYQWSGDGNHFFTNLYASYLDTGNTSLQQVWKFKMNAGIGSIPQVLTSGSDNMIVVQDKVNNLYALTTGGQKKWASQLPGKITGSIIQLDDQSLLFISANQLYRLNSDGSMLSGFPVTLPRHVTGALAASSTDPADLTLFIPCDDQISIYKASGAAAGPVITLAGAILGELKPVITNNTFHLVTATTDGRFYAYDRAGKLVSSVSAPNKSRYKNPLFIGATAGLESLRIVTTDTSGTVINLSFNGTISKINTGTWSANHVFAMANITSDEGDELIYVDNNQLYVCNNTGSPVYNFEFGHNIINRPQFFQLSSSVYQLGIASADDDALYLFNDDGLPVKGFPVKGLPGFYVGRLDNGASRYLIYGKRDNYLYLYKF